MAVFAPTPWESGPPILIAGAGVLLSIAGGSLSSLTRAGTLEPHPHGRQAQVSDDSPNTENIAPHISACLYFYVVADEESLSRAAELFKALAATSRLLILSALAQEPSTVSALTGATNLSQPLVSQHLRLLRGNNLVTATRSGREIIYSLTDDHVARVIQDAIAHSQER